MTVIVQVLQPHILVPRADFVACCLGELEFSTQLCHLLAVKQERCEPKTLIYLATLPSLDLIFSRDSREVLPV